MRHKTNRIVQKDCHTGTEPYKKVGSHTKTNLENECYKNKVFEEQNVAKKC